MKNIIMFDIDGTIKDLVGENTEALIKTMIKLGNMQNKMRGKFVLGINRINMYFIKTGLLPTNKFMQKLLLLIYSILLFKSYNEFKKVYFYNYNKKDLFFDEMKLCLRNLRKEQNNIYLVTKNVQNINILNSPDMELVKELKVDNDGHSKYYMYKELVEEANTSKNNITIVGDNLWDDVLPAIFLGVKVIWCDMYNCRLKKAARYILSRVSQNVVLNNVNEII